MYPSSLGVPATRLCNLVTHFYLLLLVFVASIYNNTAWKLGVSSCKGNSLPRHLHKTVIVEQFSVKSEAVGKYLARKKRECCQHACFSKNNSKKKAVILHTGSWIVKRKLSFSTREAEYGKLKKKKKIKSEKFLKLSERVNLQGIIILFCLTYSGIIPFIMSIISTKLLSCINESFFLVNNRFIWPNSD